MPQTMQLFNVLESVRSLEVDEPIYWPNARGQEEVEASQLVRAVPVPVQGLHTAPASNEELRLVQRLFFLGGNDTTRVVVFSGIKATDGSELTCARTAAVLAGLVTESVCLMDAASRVPVQHRQFDGDAISPLAVKGPERDKVTSISGPSLWIAPAPRMKDGRPVVSPDPLKTVLTELRKRFGFLLISAPPLGTGSEALLLAKLADGLVLTALSQSTERAAMRKVRSELDTYKVKLLGAILNQRSGQEKFWTTSERSGMN